MNALKALFFGFLQPRTYRDACHVWQGVGRLLMLLLVVLGSIYLSYQAQQATAAFCRDELPKISSQLPEIRFNEGRADTPESRRYVITAPDTGERLAVIDTSVSDIPQDLAGARIFIGKNEMTIRRNTAEKRSYSYDQWESFTLDERFVDRLGEFAASWAGWIAAPFIFIGLLVVRAVQWLFFSLPINLYLKARGLDLPYQSALRLSALAMTPVVIADIVLGALSQTIPFAGWAFAGAVILVGFAGVEFAHGQPPPAGRAQPSDNPPPPPPLP